MRIGLDVRWIFRETSGIGAYTRELLLALAAVDRENHYVLFFNDPAVRRRLLEQDGLAAAGNFSACLAPDGLFSPANQWRLPRLLAAQRVDVYHAPNYLIPLRAFPRHRPGRIRCVVSLHDLIPMVMPESAPRSRKRRLFPVYCWLMRQVGQRADIILTGSRSARADIIRCLRIPPAREPAVLVIPDGVAARFQPAPRPARTEVQTILWVGRPDPYKNLAGLLAAFARLKQTCRRPLALRLVGPLDARYPEAGQLVAQLGLAGEVTLTGHVSDDQLVREYQQADVFVLPSLYEGFGLPVLEAMACGAPVVCGNRGSLPEVAGDAALLVDPEDSAVLAAALERVLTQPQLAAELAERGRRQAARFTWETTARETLRAYRQARA